MLVMMSSASVRISGVCASSFAIFREKGFSFLLHLARGSLGFESLNNAKRWLWYALVPSSSGSLGQYNLPVHPKATKLRGTTSTAFRESNFRLSRSFYGFMSSLTSCIAKSCQVLLPIFPLPPFGRHQLHLVEQT